MTPTREVVEAYMRAWEREFEKRFPYETLDTDDNRDLRRCVIAGLRAAFNAADKSRKKTK